MATVAVAGVIAIEVKPTTVRVAVPETPCELAVIAEEPPATAVAKPVPEIVATLGVPELQVTEFDTSEELPFANWAVALNCCVAPGAMDAAEGVTAIDVILLLSDPLQPAKTTRLHTTNSRAA